MESMKKCLDYFKCSFFSLKLSFLVREYIISILIFSSSFYFFWRQGTLIFSLGVLLILNSILFPFSKYLYAQIREWIYLYIYQIDHNTIYRPIGCVSLLFKGCKNLFLFSFSFMIGWIGLIVLMLVVSKNEKA